MERRPSRPAMMIFGLWRDGCLLSKKPILQAGQRPRTSSCRKSNRSKSRLLMRSSRDGAGVVINQSLRWFRPPSRTGYLASTQSFDAPALAVFAANEMVGFGQIEFKLGRVPFQRGLREARGHAANQHGFRQRSRVAEVRRGLTVALTCLEELLPMVSAADIREFEILQFRVGIQQRLRPVRQYQHA